MVHYSHVVNEPVVLGGLINHTSLVPLSDITGDITGNLLIDCCLVEVSQWLYYNINCIIHV